MKMKWIELLNKIANNEIEEGTRFRMPGGNINLIYRKNVGTGHFEMELEGIIYPSIIDFDQLNDEIEIIDTKEV